MPQPDSDISVTTGTEGRIWIHSDLQLATPERARACLDNAVDDLLSLKLPLDAAWCLGDATVGAELDDLEIVVRETKRILDRLAVPVCYLMGNHELDTRRQGILRYPLFEAAQQWPDWHTADTLSDFYFERLFFGCRVFFFGDHAAADGSWWVSHGSLQSDAAERYPHSAQRYRELCDRMACSTGPVLLAAHCALPGGQRPAPLLERLLPLPATVRAHFYGHAHIGDLVFNKENPWQRDNPVEGQPVPRQYNISALESRRSPGSHSALLEFSGGQPRRLRIRCHLERRWLDTFVLPA